MKLLELYAGSRSVGKQAEKLGMEVFSVDWSAYDNIDLQMDIGELRKSDVPFIPDVIWCSPDCTTYSIAACSTHRTNRIEPKSEYAAKCDKVNVHVLKLIREWLLINPNLIYFIENPRGLMRKMPFMLGLTRYTVWYCTYGDSRAKPTDIWTNSKTWQPRQQCWNRNQNCHHEAAPRGSQTGTQGKKNSYDRSKIPDELCKEVLNSTYSKTIVERFNNQKDMFTKTS